MSESHVNKRLLSKDISLSENVYSMGSPQGTFFVLFSLSQIDVRLIIIVTIILILVLLILILILININIAKKN